MKEPVNILLVDDRPSNLSALEAVLRRPDYNLLLARCGEEALAHVLRTELAVILLDIAMPRMDGFETASIIKERDESKLIPIIFITASVYDVEHILRRYTVGAVDYLRKPLDPQRVRSKVAVFVELFRQRKQLERQARRLREAELREQRVVRERADEALRVREVLYERARELATAITPLRLQAASLVREEQAEPAEDAASKCRLRRLREIDVAAARMESLIERLLEVAGPSIGKLTHELEDSNATRG